RAPRRRRRMLDVSRARRSDGRRSHRSTARDAVVRRMPPRSHEQAPAEGPDHEHGVDARQESAGLEAASGQSAHQLLRVPPMKRTPSSLPSDTTHWTSLEHKRDPELQKQAASKEFLHPIPEEGLKLSRRGAMGAAAASAALLSEACIRRPVEHILPYTKAPEYIIPGVANHYATVLTVRGEADGVIVESHEGRPTKIE